MLKCSSRWTRGSKSSSSIRSDCASVPIRGSRFVGLLSMIITTVFASGRLAQETMLTHSKIKTRFNHREHRGTQRALLVQEYVLCAFLCPLWLNIRDFSQHGGSFGSRGRWHVARQTVKRLVRQ